MPENTHVICARGVTLKFTLNSNLVIPLAASSGRRFNGIFEGCNIDGTSTTTYPSSVAIDLLNATDWIFKDIKITNAATGIAIETTDPVNFGANYNRFFGIIINASTNYGVRIDSGTNSNSFFGVRIVDAGYGIYCSGNQNSFVGGQVETYTANGFAGNSGCTGSTVSGYRFEAAATAINLASGSNYNTFTGAYCEAISGSTYSNSGTGNTKTGGNC